MTMSHGFGWHLTGDELEPTPRKMLLQILALEEEAQTVTARPVSASVRDLPFFSVTFI